MGMTCAVIFDFEEDNVGLEHHKIRLINTIQENEKYKFIRNILAKLNDYRAYPWGGWHGNCVVVTYSISVNSLSPYVKVYFPMVSQICHTCTWKTHFSSLQLYLLFILRLLGMSMTVQNALRCPDIMRRVNVRKWTCNKVIHTLKIKVVN